MVTYKSTRGGVEGVKSAQAILKGIADDGGLFVPEYIPEMDFTLEELLEMDYHTLAYRVLTLFFPDFSKEDLKNSIKNAYDSKFTSELIAPINKKGDLNFLELFHGGTLAFKDMALSILPYLMMSAAKSQGLDKDVVILTATSGDTGKAALDGFDSVEGTKIIVFFPEDGVSEIQKRQMVTQKGKNTCVIGINGNFDDAQTGVKEIFGDKDFNKLLEENDYTFSSANSINIGRLVPQVVYYFYAYAQLVNNKDLQVGDTMNVVVPTGNFGNILAAYYAKEMGLPIGNLICASNNNKVLYDFFKNGIYDRNRDFHVTMSPSMDILISSNLERLLYTASNDNVDEINYLMSELKDKGSYTISDDIKENLFGFYASFADDERTQKVIKEVYDELDYLMDTHTAVAYSAYKDYKEKTGDKSATVIVSTASPYKFPASVMGALDKDKYKDASDFELVDKMQDLVGGEIPKEIKNLENEEITHNRVIEKKDMSKTIKEFLNLR